MEVHYEVKCKCGKMVPIFPAPENPFYFRSECVNCGLCLELLASPEDQDELKEALKSQGNW